MSKQAKRTDAHRVGAIIPEDYEYVLSYSLPTTDNGVTVPAFGINCEIDHRVEGPAPEYKLIKNGEHRADGMCCVVGLNTVAGVRFAEHGTTGKCTICGARFIEGDIWKHTSGEYIHVGHTCSDKYTMLAERGDFNAKLEAHRRATAARRLAEQNRAEREKFLAEHDGLGAALETDHEIVRDIKRRFEQYRSLSEKQIALVMKLADEAQNPKPAKPEELHVPAPEGRTLVRGKVVSMKFYEGDYGSSWKMTVKVETSAGTWLAWGTCPRALLDAACDKFGWGSESVEKLRGAEIEFTANLKRGRDQHFALTERPTKAKVIAFAEPREPAAA